VCRGGADDGSGGTAGNNPIVETLANATSGQATITVTFSQTTLVAQLTLLVVTTREARVVLRPYPEYTGSDAVVVNTLSRINNSFSSTDIYQQARLFVIASMQNGTNFTISTSSAANVTFVSADDVAYDASASIVSNAISSTELAITDRTVTIGCTAGRVACTTTTLTLTHTAVRVTRLSAPRLWSQRTAARATYDLVGLNGTTDQIILGATFSDGTEIPALFQSDGTPRFPGLITFASGLSSAVQVTPTGGVTLRANHHVAVPVTVSVGDDPSVSPVVVSLACNLNPATGDVDLGAAVGLPLGPTIVGATMTMPVRVNSGGRSVS
jgi:hypothetical protein